MTFSTPQSEDSPTFPAQAVIDATDLAAILAAASGTGLVSGCGVTPNSSGVNLNITVAAGTVLVAGASVAVAGGTGTVTAASSGDRRDIVTVNSSGTVVVTAGTPCSVAGWTSSSLALPPVKPAIPASSCLLAEVYVPGAATSITASNLVAKAAQTATNAPGTLLAVTSYDNGGTPHTYSTTSSTSADVDATNLAATFTAPANGIVLVRLTGFMQMATNTDYGYWSVREGSSDLTTKQIVVSAAGATATVSSCKVFRITGVSAGSHTYKWGLASGSGTASIYVGTVSLGDAVATIEVLAGL